MEFKHYTNYALRVLLYTAAHNERPVSMKEIAQAYQISLEHLRKVIHHLGKLGYLQTKRGKSGGIRLGPSPEDVRIGDVVIAMEGSTELIDCDRRPCPLSGICALKCAVNGATQIFVGQLNEHSVATLIDQWPMRERLRTIEGRQADG